MNLNELIAAATNFAPPEADRLLERPLPMGGDLARWLDHTLLKPESTAAQVEAVCREALEYGFAAVCVNPAFVPLVARRLAGSPVKVCTVVGFPLGATLAAQKQFETLTCLQAGAVEIDMVLNIGALKGGDAGLVLNEIYALAQITHNQGGLLKVILETGLLTREEMVLACLLSKEAGADFVKTSTGFASGGAVAADVGLMRAVVGEQLGVKASGGIRTLADAYAMITAGASRLGVSAGVRIMQETLGREP